MACQYGVGTYQSDRDCSEVVKDVLYLAQLS